MNVFTKITLGSLWQNKLRTLLIIVGVALSAALISSVLAFSSSFQHFMVQYERQMTGDWYASVYSPKEIDLLKAKRDEGTEAIGTYREIGYMMPEEMKDHYKPYIQVVEVDEVLQRMAGIQLIEGRMPGSPEELLVPVNIATEGGKPLRLGEKISGNLGMRVSKGSGETPKGKRLTADEPYEEGEVLHTIAQREYTVVGISEPISITSYNTPAYMAISVSEAEIDTTFSENPKEGTVAYIKTKKPDAITKYVREFFPENTIEYNENLLRYLDVTHFGDFAAIMSVTVGVLIFLIMIGSIALIYNAFSITVGERIKQYGILSSIGATKRQRKSSIIMEGLFIGVAGIPLGMGLGIGGIWVALKMMGRFVVDITEGNVTADFGLHLNLPILLLMVALSLITVLLSVVIPAIRGSRISIIDAIGGVGYTRERNRVFRIPKFLKKRVDFEQILSWRYFQQRGRKYRATIISLTLSMTLFILANFAGSYFLSDEAYANRGDTSYNVEYIQPQHRYVASKADEKKEIFKKLSAAPGIITEKKMEFINFNEDPEGLGRNVPVIVMEERNYQAYTIRTGLFTKAPTAVLLETEFWDSRNMRGESKGVEMYGSDGSRFIVSGNGVAVKEAIAKNLPPGAERYIFNRMLVMPQASAEEFFGDYREMVTEIGAFYQCRDSAKTYDAMKKICREEGIVADDLRNVVGDDRDTKNLLIMINVFAYSFVILISLIAVVNVFHTISTNIMLRRREFAVLCAVGMTKSGLAKVVGYESLIYGVRALILSLSIPMIISVLFYIAFLWDSGIPYLFPWRGVIISVALVFLSVFVTMSYAIGKIRREDLMKALRKENL